MKTALHQDSRGIAHIALVVIGVAVLGVVGFAGWRVMQRQKSKTSNATATNDLAQIISQAKCDYDDKDLCKFLTGWKQTKQFKVPSTDVSDGKTTTSVFESDNNKYHMSIGGEMAYEFISIGDVTYTKAPNGTWWKQTMKSETTNKLTENYDYDFKDPDESSEPAKKTEYKKISKEACGSLQCFKYQVIEADAAGETQFVWFDDKDYQLRRVRVENSDGTSEQLFTYEKVSISEPSPVKELGPNQYLIPGQNEPQTVPSAEDYQRMFQGAQ